MTKWAIELSELKVSFEGRKVLKAQLFTNFLAKMTTIPHEPDHTWVIFTDRSFNNKGSNTCVILENNFGLEVEVSVRFEFPNTNN